MHLLIFGTHPKPSRLPAPEPVPAFLRGFSFLPHAVSIPQNSDTWYKISFFSFQNTTKMPSERLLPFRRHSRQGNTLCRTTAPKPPPTAAIWRARAHCGAPPA
ncbi:dihydroxy-acid dehydratase [Neisseria lactamica ATCC 23970]|uniref:Dihydroxy-acid dehydratase n=1 Tax=Neisseria lactamica ATCC 23970 TaxID=546265 RepID=D0W794_NEILA|nr:dihydroxy-acid dehydratase [Neisseria lactamica ATCC 23970]